MNTPPSYSSRLRVSLAIARGIAATRGDDDLTPLHVALGILREGENPAVAALMHAGVDVGAVRFDMERALDAPAGLPRPGEVCIGATEGEQSLIDAATAPSHVDAIFVHRAH